MQHSNTNSVRGSRIDTMWTPVFVLDRGGKSGRTARKQV